MGENTGISWTDATFNPWWGCAKVSAECTNCYAESTDARYHGDDPHWGVNAPRRFFGDKHWNEPHRWDAKAAADGVRRRVFCASMADVFEDRPDLEPHRHRLWNLIANTPNLDWLLLTKRPESFAKMLPWLQCDQGHDHAPWPNVWLGVTAGNEQSLRERVPVLRETPAAVRFISCEPLLEHISREAWDRALSFRHHDHHDHVGSIVTDGNNEPSRIHWVIVGDESAPPAKRRAAQVDWVRTAREAALSHRVAWHLKQWNGPEGGGISGRLGDKRKIHLPMLDGRQWAQFPSTGAK